MKHMILCAALVASACLGGAGAAMAQSDEMHIRVGDLDMKSSAGARSELARIHGAATVFCSRDEGRTTLNRQMLGRACERAMTGKMVAKLDEPLVTALHQQEYRPALAHKASRRILAER